MPWCERCQCYHYDTAPHIRRRWRLPNLTGWMLLSSISIWVLLIWYWWNL